MPGLHCTSAPLADEPECALCGVLHLPSEPVDFAPQAVSLAKISTPPRRVTCLSESSQVRWGLGVILIDGHAEDPETVNHLNWYMATGFTRPYPGEKKVRPPSDFNKPAPAGDTDDN